MAGDFVHAAAAEMQAVEGPEVAPHSGGDIPPSEFDPEPRARDFIRWLIDGMWREEVMDRYPRYPGGDVVQSDSLEATWPADLRSSSTPKGGLGTSSMTQKLMTDLSHATTRCLLRLWLSKAREHVQDWTLSFKGAPTIALLALAQGMHAASLLMEELSSHKARQPLKVQVVIKDWSDDELTLEPACCVLQNLLAALQSGFLVLHDPYQYGEIQLSSCKHGEQNPARLELERLALLMSAQFHLFSVTGLHQISLELLVKDLLANDPGRVSLKCLVLCPEASARSHGLVIRGETIMGYDINTAGEADGLLRILGCGQQKFTSHFHLRLVVEVNMDKIQAPGGSEYIQVRHSILQSIATRAVAAGCKISIELSLRKFSSISDVDDMLRRCLPAPCGCRLRGASSPWRPMRLLLDVRGTKLLLQDLLCDLRLLRHIPEEPNSDDYMVHHSITALSAVADAGIEHLTLRMWNYSWLFVIDSHKRAWSLLLERTLEHSAHLQGCSVEIWDNPGDDEDDYHDRSVHLPCTIRAQTNKTFQSISRMLRRNRDLPLLVETLKQFARSESNPLSKKLVLVFKLLEYLQPVDPPIRQKVMTLCGCRPPAEAAGQALPSPSDIDRHDPEGGEEGPAGFDSGRSAQYSPTSSAAVPQVAQPQPEEPGKEQDGNGVDEGLQQAVAVSMEATVAEYNGQLARAMQESVWEQPNPAQCVAKGPLDMQSCMRFELSRGGGGAAEAVSDLVMHAPELEHQRRRVLEAGCQLQPPWASGSMMLVPVTEEMFLECGPHPIEGKHYIYGLPEDKDAINAALKKIEKKKRPRAKAPLVECDSTQPSTAADTTLAADAAAAVAASSAGGSNIRVEGQAVDEVDNERVELVVKGTFLDMRIVREQGCSASAPADLQSLRGPAASE